MSMDLLPLEAEEARTLFGRLRERIEDVKGIVVRLYAGRAWLALGYSSWEEACEEELGGRLAIPKDERQEVIMSLRDTGLSTRAIAAVTGMSKDTVHRAVVAVSNETPEPAVEVYQSDTPAPEPVPEPSYLKDPVADVAEILGDPDDEVVEAEIVDREPEPVPTITGRDGKQYQATRPSSTNPRRRPWFDTYSDAVTAIERATTTLENLARDDRAGKHSEQAIGRTNDLLRAIDALAGVANQLRNEEPTR